MLDTDREDRFYVAILKLIHPVHLEIQTHRANPVGVLRSSFRDGDKIKHTNHGRITGLALDQLKLIQAAFRGEVVPRDSPQAFQTLNSREYGASHRPSCSWLRNWNWTGLSTLGRNHGCRIVWP